ncbi:hypothetical protein NKI04_24000, partial [Mesorhizobium sp. M0814]|uniref:hypothetical protein n=2 Tax=Mesorhizobium TaxID=68287 RepID=UPI003337802A
MLKVTKSDILEDKDAAARGARYTLHGLTTTQADWSSDHGFSIRRLGVKRFCHFLPYQLLTSFA